MLGIEGLRGKYEFTAKLIVVWNYTCYSKVLRFEQAQFVRRIL